MSRWMIVKGCVPVQICDTVEEAESVYARYDADEIRKVEDDYEPPLVVTPLKDLKT